MSVIFGIINKNGEAINEGDAIKMRDSLLHRAIDGKGFLIEGEIMFGHHKLIVHRRQTYEEQPLESDGCIITADARIDNTDELSKELELDSQLNITDSLIILKAYKKWGNDCVNYLEGEFAFAIWNKQTKTFYGATDHIGFRTFYYYENSKIFAFASEIKALASIKPEAVEINEELFFKYMNFLAPVTYDKNIHILLSAHYLLLTKNSTLKINQYWVAVKSNKYKFHNANECKDYLLKLITKKIESQIDSDYPIGILLSGGLDSSFVAAIACKLLKQKNKKLLAFCSVLPDDYKGNAKDERFYIEKLKDHFDNLEVHYISIPEETGPYSDLTKAFDRVESLVNPYHYVESALFDRAKKLNVRTLLTGLGGDLTISNNGYGVIFKYLTEFKVLKSFDLFIKRYKRGKHSLAQRIKMEILTHIPVYQKIRDYIKPNQFHLYSPYKKEVLKTKNKVEKKVRSRESILTGSLNRGEIGILLLSSKKHAVAFNMEFLSPLLDKQVCELSFNIPGEYYLQNGVKRSLIKEAMKNMVPDDIIRRTDKLPFALAYNEKEAKINTESVKHLFKNKILLEKNTPIDFELLQKLILKTEIKNEGQRNSELAFITNAVFLAEFYLYLTSIRIKEGKY